MKKIRFGVIGGSGMARGHMEGVTKNENAELVAFCELDDGRIAEVKALYPDIAVYKDYKELLRCGIDAVIVVSPDQLHREMCVEALSLGLHVLCEKPLALTEEDAAAIRDAAAASDKKFMVGQICRYTPSFVKAKELVDAGRIGDLTFVESEYAHDYGHIYEDALRGTWRKDPLRNGVVGGGCHAIDLLRWIAGDVTEVCGISNKKYYPELPYDDTHVAIMKFEGGVIGKVFVSVAVKRNGTLRSLFYGTKGTIITDNGSETMTLFYTDDEGKLQTETITVEVNSHNAVAEVAEFCDIIVNEKEVLTTATEGYKTVKTANAIVKSADMGGVPVKL
ncbi:MAG: Gfo/Idh/MocA family oxidoreductase [Clostridia bacterium]|nr:Gfo/Idh/MocA family oxidoreductase [Clostridia bacterium]